MSLLFKILSLINFFVFVEYISHSEEFLSKIFFSQFEVMLLLDWFELNYSSNNAHLSDNLARLAQLLVVLVDSSETLVSGSKNFDGVA